MNQESAETAIRHGSIAGFISAGVTLVFTVLAILVPSADGQRLALDAMAFLDVVLIAALAYGIRRRSRVAAILMLVYFLISKISIAIETERLTGLWMSLVFVYFFVRATLGTFAYHRIRRRQDPVYKPTSRWTYFVWTPICLLTVCIVGMGLLFQLGIAPDNAVVSGSDLRGRTLELLRSQGILLPEEEVILFYSAGIFSFLVDGNILTDRRVIAYETVDDILTVEAVEYSRIKKVALVSRGSDYEDTSLFVTTLDGELIGLIASTEGGGDERFLAEVNARWKAATEPRDNVPPAPQQEERS